MSHYDAIGFTGITDKDSLVDTAKRVLPHTQNIGHCAVYRDASGAELWLGMDGNDSICAIEPYFSGGPHNVWIASAQPNEYGDGTGFAQVWQNGSRAEDGECLDGDYPFVLDVPDIAMFPGRVAGSAQKIVVCAFAGNAQLFADETAYAASQAEQEVKWAARNFVPIGMFMDENAPESARPDARAMFTGLVRTAEKRRNTVTNSLFYYCEIDTHGGVWSAVYPAGAFDETPQAGNIIQGEYWITGRLAAAPAPEAAHAKRSFWKKLLGK